MKRTYAFFHAGKHFNLAKGAGENNTRYSTRLNFIIERVGIYDFSFLEQYSQIYADSMLYGCEYPEEIKKVLNTLISKEPLEENTDAKQEVVEELEHLLLDDKIKSFDGQTVIMESGAMISSIENDSYMTVDPNTDISGASVIELSLGPSSDEGEKIGLVVKVEKEDQEITIKSCDRTMCKEPSEVLFSLSSKNSEEEANIVEIIKPVDLVVLNKADNGLSGVEMFGDPEAKNFFLAMEHVFNFVEDTSILAIFFSELAGKKPRSLDPEEIRDEFQSLGPFSDEEEDIAMKKAVEIKFLMENFANKLKSTKNKTLVYNNSAEDYWGNRWGNSLNGSNRYGVLLMELRDRLREEQEYGLSVPKDVEINTEPIPLQKEPYPEIENVQIESEKELLPPIGDPEKIISEPLKESEKPQEDTEKPQENAEKPQEDAEKPQENAEKPQEDTEKIISEPLKESEKPQEDSEKIISEPLKESEKPQENTEKIISEPLKESEKPQGESLCDSELNKIERSLIISRFEDRLMRGNLIKYENSILEDLFRAYDVGLFGGKISQASREIPPKSLKIQISWDDNSSQETPGVSDVSRDNNGILCSLTLSKFVFSKLSGNRKGDHKVFGIVCRNQFEVIMTFMESFCTMIALELSQKDSSDPEVYANYARKFFNHEGTDCTFAPPDDDLRQKVQKLKSNPLTVVKVTLRDGKEYEVAGARSTTEIMLNDGDEKKRVPYSEVTHLNGEPL